MSLNNCKLITRQDIFNLRKGSHIIYTKYIIDKLTGKRKKKIIDCGELIDIEGKQFYNMMLVVRNKNIHRLRYLQHDFYVRNDFINDTFREKYKNEINKKTDDAIDAITMEIARLTKENKNKHYIIMQ